MDASALDGLLADLHASAPGGLEVRRDGACTLLQAAPADLPVVMRLLREQAGLNYLANLTAVDRGESFEVVYHLFRIPADGAQ
ncbi:MAG: NADH-quinone oxidoreductase subunit C, partial [Syntrophomonadaceae bacterium]|nr:NADH-quinone oxidoreductase subunit C [Syntrophomonadaceae bacterium]